MVRLHHERGHKTVLADPYGRLIGNWTITLSVNFGSASLLAGTATICRSDQIAHHRPSLLRITDHPNWVASSWQLLLIFYAFCIGVFLICTFGNRLLPYVDTVAAIWNGVTILIVLIALSATAKAGRHSASDTLGYYDTTISGWNGFSFFIGLLPAAYTYAALGMISSMAEEVRDPAVVSSPSDHTRANTHELLCIVIEAPPNFDWLFRIFPRHLHIPCR